MTSSSACRPQAAKVGQGPPYTGSPLTAAARALMKQQAREANAGIAVQAWIGGVERGFWYDLSGPQPVYR